MNYTNPGNFPAWELTFSQTATRLGLKNRPDQRQWGVLQRAADHMLQPARGDLGPLRITSGYRCPELNSAIGGSRRSDHMILGDSCAFDLYPLRTNLLKLYQWMAEVGPTHKVIWEFGRWVHVSYKLEGDPQRRLYRARRVVVGTLEDGSNRWITKYEPIRPEDIDSLQEDR
jgi:hypothetical protein